MQLNITKWPNLDARKFSLQYCQPVRLNILEYYSSDFFFFLLGTRITNRYEYGQDVLKIVPRLREISNSSTVSEFLWKIKNAPLPIIPLPGINR